MVDLSRISRTEFREQAAIARRIFLELIATVGLPTTVNEVPDPNLQVLRSLDPIKRRRRHQ